MKAFRAIGSGPAYPRLPREMVSMKLNIRGMARQRSISGWLTAALTATVAAAMVAVTPTQALAIATPVPLGTADAFAVLAGESITNTGPSVITAVISV